MDVDTPASRAQLPKSGIRGEIPTMCSVRTSNNGAGIKEEPRIVPDLLSPGFLPLPFHPALSLELTPLLLCAFEL